MQLKFIEASRLNRDGFSYTCSFYKITNPNAGEVYLDWQQAVPGSGHYQFKLVYSQMR